jgi:hypothetical protein
MEHLTGNVAIGGNLGNVLYKNLLTIPEVVMLRNIHGESSVFNIAVVGDIDSDDMEERNRLGILYSDQKVEEVFGTYGALPQTFEDARIDDGYLDKVFLQNKAQKSVKKAKPKAKPKRARDSKGHFIADDPNTEVNEAYEPTAEEDLDAKG